MAAGSVACDSAGQVSLDLILPEDPSLSPAGDRLAQVTLVTWEPGQPAHRETRAVDSAGDGVDMGMLADGAAVELAIELRTASDRLIGYGRSPQPIEPSAGEDTTVEIQVRRPFVYAGGALDRLYAFDSTLDAEDDGTFGAVGVVTPLASAATPDGAELVVVSAVAGGAELRLVATATHAASTAPAIPLRGQVSDVAVSSDGRFALVAHDGDGGGVSLIELDAARAGSATVVFVDLGPVGAIAPAGDQAVALLDRSRAFGCDAAAPASSVAVVEIDGGSLVGVIELADAAADVAATADGSALYFAQPCKDAITALDVGDGGLPTSSEPTAFLSLSQALSVAVQGDRVWGAGSLPPTAEDGARVVLVESTVGGDDASQVELPPAQERAQSTDFEGEDQTVEVVIDADLLRPFELSPLPGGDLVALLSEGTFHSEEWVDVFGNTVVSEIEITSFEYQLIDVSTRALVHRLRVFCEETASPGAALENFQCGEGPDQQVLRDAEMFRPSQLTALFGGR